MDDMGFGDLGVNGDPSRETYHLDKMASEGMQFLDFYAANPLCSPSRAALMTGRLPIRNGFYTTNVHARNSYTPQEIVGGISEKERLISEVLKEIGYQNMIIGKWHLGHRLAKYFPLNRGFDHFYGSFGVHFGPYDNVTKPNVAFFRDNEMIGRYYQNIMIENHVSTILKNFTEEAISFMDNESSKGNPFFLYWTPDTLHAPTYRSPEFVNRSIKNSSYGDALIEMDHSIGQIMDFIKNDQCLKNNTFVFFTSDNGPALVSKIDAGSNGPLLCGKQTTLEGGFRVPGIAWWPGKIKPGTSTHQISTHMDLFRTIVNLVNGQMPTGRQYDSNDLLPVLFDEKVNSNVSMFYYRGDTLMAIRHGPYKAHYWTFTTPMDEIKHGIDFCPGQFVEHLTTNNLTDHHSSPLLFHLFRDPAERYRINPESTEYKETMKKLAIIYEEHQKNLIPGEPQLNYCDKAAMPWHPPGCSKFCLPTPKSSPYLCEWPH